jgi:hypothetical protein
VWNPLVVLACYIAAIWIAYRWLSRYYPACDKLKAEMAAVLVQGPLTREERARGV